ncbi:MAG: DUF177 domain-containing protein [Sphingobacteriales bacterium]|nr:MAG: DUF177 domain-containing protein [Sphingobacteriales bacterium]TAF80191.1 MAG: DUF177 domain-containing protein [Sphingobacteriales bacterium]
MKPLKLFLLPFTGLKLGNHQFEYKIDNTFFEAFEYSIAKTGDCNILLNLEKQETMLILDFNVEGNVFLTCDKCLGNYPQAISAKDRLIVKFSHEDLSNSTDEVVVLSKNESEFDISFFIYEIINLAIPYVSVCENPGKLAFCDIEVLNKIQTLSANKEPANDTTNSPWEILKNIKNN